MDQRYRNKFAFGNRGERNNDCSGNESSSLVPVRIAADVLGTSSVGERCGEAMSQGTFGEPVTDSELPHVPHRYH